ncbi:MAG TPA: hypothetical protein VN599_07375 [Rudaea sp.]|nr:hypothetical protein [Rudaea sp.]
MRKGGAVPLTPEQLACAKIDTHFIAWCLALRARHLHVTFAA